MPYEQDSSQLLLYMNQHIHTLFQSAGVLEQRIQERFDYFSHSVLNLVKAFTA